MQLFAGARRSYPLDGPHFSPHLRGALRLARSVFMAACHDYPRCCAVSQHPPPLPCQSRHGCTHPAFVALRQLPPRSALSAHFPPPVLGPFSMQQLVELKVQCHADHWRQLSQSNKCRMCTSMTTLARKRRRMLRHSTASRIIMTCGHEHRTGKSECPTQMGAKMWTIKRIASPGTGKELH